MLQRHRLDGNEKKKKTPPKSWLVFIIIQVPSGYLLRVSVAGPSGRWLASLPGGPRSARAGGWWGT